MAVNGLQFHISFVTFAMFIIDEIEWRTPNPPAPKTNLIGGAGTYAVLGARLAASPSQSLPQTISWIVDVGSDFPLEVKSSIDAWKTNCIFRQNSGRLTTRAWNGYGANDVRAFKYLTPKIRLEVSSLNPAQVMSKSFHMICSPARCIEITTKLQKARREINPVCDDPVIIWEPIPDLCGPEQLALLQEAASKCTIISPNEEELKMFFPSEITNAETQSQLVTRLMGWDAPELATSVPNHPPNLLSGPSVIVREGSNGSTAYFHKSNSTLSGCSSIHLPAYHTRETSQFVTDPTGGGNTYLGALGMVLGLISTNTITNLPTYHIFSEVLATSTDTTPNTENKTISSLTDQRQPQNFPLHITYAMIYALIAASFAIEQNGTPTLTDTSAINGNTEMWNGETVQNRMRSYLVREKDEIMNQIQASSR